MSHTTKLDDDWVVIHDSDPSHNDLVTLVGPGGDIVIPHGVLMEYAAAYVRDQRIAQIEDMSYGGLFGIPERLG